MYLISEYITEKLKLNKNIESGITKNGDYLYAVFADNTGEIHWWPSNKYNAVWEFEKYIDKKFKYLGGTKYLNIFTDVEKAKEYELEIGKKL